MRTLVLGDLHLEDKVKGHLNAQLGCLDTLIYEAKPDEIILLGDVFMHRSPSPKVLAYLKSYLRSWKQTSTIHILRGNHDSANKSDDNLTVLEVYRDPGVHIWHKAGKHNDKYFIPHYENEETIRRLLSECPENFKVFGHFGYRGCLNSAGDADSTLRLSAFQRKTYLGHIHNFKQDGLVTILGTPYSTNFGEAGTKGYYLILDGSKEEFTEIDYGPRHVVASLEYVKENRDYLSDGNWFTLLRINLLPGESASDIPDDLSVAHLDIKVVPSFDEDSSFSAYKPRRDLFTINDQIIEDYVDTCLPDVQLSKEALMGGYSLLKEGLNED